MYSCDCLHTAAALMPFRSCPLSCQAANSENEWTRFTVSCFEGPFQFMNLASLAAKSCLLFVNVGVGNFASSK